MDAQFRAHAHAPRPRHIAGQGLVIGKCQGDAVNRRAHTGQSRNQDQMGAHGIEFFAVTAHARVRSEIDRTKYQPVHRGRAGQFPSAVPTKHTFDNRQQALIRAQAFGQLDQQIGFLRLGQYQATHAWVAEQIQITIKPRRSVSVTPQINRLVRVQPLANGCAGRNLGLWRHRILQVNDHRMGAGGHGLVKTLGTVARDK